MAKELGVHLTQYRGLVSNPVTTREKAIVRAWELSGMEPGEFFTQFVAEVRKKAKKR